MIKRPNSISAINTLILAAAGVSGLSAQVQDFFPLETGNRWVYRGVGQFSRETLTIEVGPTTTVENQVYFQVVGYAAPGTVLVRRAQDGSLFTRKTGQPETLLTRFTPGEPYDTSIADPCNASATPQSQRVPFRFGGTSSSTGGPTGGGTGGTSGGTGKEYSALAIRYRNLNCADAGLEEELYIENLGLVRRTVTSFAGPKTFELVEGRAGGISVETLPGTSFKLSVDAKEYQLPNPVIRGTVRLRVTGTNPLSLKFNSSQRFDLVLVDPTGRRVAPWSADKLFLPALGEEQVAGELAFTFEYPIPGGWLEPGEYKLEGWLTTTGEDKVFSTTAAITLRGITTQ